MALREDTSDRQTNTAETRAVTPRAVLAALVVGGSAVLWDEWNPYYIDGSNISRSHFPMAFFFPFLLLCSGNLLLRHFGSRWYLSKPELLVVLGSGLVAIAVPYDGLTGHLIGILAGPYYFASTENGWGLYLHNYLPKWIVPTNNADEMTWFYEGVPTGGVPPFEAWLTPLFWWMCFLGSMAFAVFCIVVILRKQWSSSERLPYPLVEVGSSLTDSDAAGFLSRCYHSPLFWIAFGLVMALKMWNMASYFTPAFPYISIEETRWRAFPDFPIVVTRLSFYAIGFGYFARLDVLLSVWFFIVLTAFQVFIFNRFGYPAGAADNVWSSDALGWQSQGALFFLAGWSVWMARRHLRDVWRKAVGRDDTIDDSNEMLSYRTAVFGFLISVAFSSAWLYAAGMEVWVIVTFLPVVFLSFLGISRVVAELGLVYAYYKVQPYDVFLDGLGTPALGPSSVTILSLLRVFSSFPDIGKGFLMPAFTQAAKVVDGVVNPRRIAKVLWITLGLSFVLSVSDTLYLGYRYGAYNLGNMGLKHVAPLAFSQAVSAIRNPIEIGGDGRAMWGGIGIVLMAVMTLMRYRFSWWPIHPIGFAVMGNFGVTKTVFSTFLAWFFKSLLLRVGGVKMYEKGKPFFVGLLAAQAVSTFIVFVVDWFWFPFQGHNVHNF